MNKEMILRLNEDKIEMAKNPSKILGDSAVCRLKFLEQELASIYVRDCQEKLWRAYKKEREEILAGGSFKDEPAQDYWTRRAFEITQELFRIETGNDPVCSASPQDYSATHNLKVRELEIIKAIINRSEINVETNVRVSVLAIAIASSGRRKK